MRPLIICLLLLLPLISTAQPKSPILKNEPGSVTFAVDEVSLPDKLLSSAISGEQLARWLNPMQGENPFEEVETEILFNSFASAQELYDIGEDVVFQMLLKAWCQHLPVVLSPDVVWLLICQQFSYYVNQNPEQMRPLLVSHEGQKMLAVKTGDLFSQQADWTGLIRDFAGEIGKYTSDGFATTFIGDFSTTGPDERIVSEVTLMSVVKPYFDYVAVNAICGIPSITLTGTPEDWRQVQAKARSLERYGLGWWASELEPILEAFVNASEGHPDYWFWKDIVKKSRPRRIQGPSCSRQRTHPTQFDGWFLKLFPFGNGGRTPDKVTLLHTMPAETVAVPFTYQIVDGAGVVLSETPMELVAGIVGVQQDETTLMLTPKIGWFVRTVNQPSSEQ